MSSVQGVRSVKAAILWLDAGVTDWASLGDAYGRADHLPALLAAAEESGPEAEAAWELLDCPTCHEQLQVTIDDSPTTVESYTDGSLPPTVVAPIEPAPATVEGHLIALTRAHNRPAIANRLPYLFGTATCPRCQDSFPITEALT